MYILSTIKYGIGNKLFILVYLIYLYKNITQINKIYIVQKKSKFEKELINIYKIFPNLKKLSWLKFIDWKIYDKLKVQDRKNIINIDANNISIEELKVQKQNIIFTGNMNVTFNSIYFQDYMKKYFTFSSSIQNKIFIKKNLMNEIILIHIRLGDKLNIVYNNIIKKISNVYIVSIYTPEFYKYCIQQILNKNKKIKYVFIFTDSSKIVERFYIPLLKSSFQNLHFKIENKKMKNYEIIYIFSIFKYIILSDSTLTYFGTYLSQVKERIIWNHYYSILSKKKNNYQKNNYIIKKNKDYKYIKDKTYFLSNHPELIKKFIQYS